MENNVNQVMSSAAEYVKEAAPAKADAKTAKAVNPKLLEQKPDSVELSTNSDKKVDKPGFLKSFGTGMLTNLKMLVPFYNNYTIGKEYLEQENIMKDLQNIKEGKEADSKKPGVFKSWITGVGLGLAYSVPILGSYLIGKQRIEQDNAVKELNGEQTKDVNFLKSLGKGIVSKIGYAVPFFSTYSIGQEFAEQDKLKEAVDKMKDEQKAE